MSWKVGEEIMEEIEELRYEFKYLDVTLNWKLQGNVHFVKMTNKEKSGLER